MYSKKIFIYNLKENMITSEDLIVKGRKLLNKDYTITGNVLNSLRNNYPSYYISIYSDDADAFIEYENSKFESLEKQLLHTESLIKNLFEKVKGNSTTNMADLHAITKNVLEYTEKPTTNIVKLLNRSSDPDEYLYFHSLNVALLAVLIGRWLKVPKNSLTNLASAGILHDVGKLFIPSNIINKKGHLTSEEFKICKTHSLKSYEISKKIPLLSPSVLQGILFHHERFDGSGYPTHLEKDTIPLFARIIAVSDIFDAITSNHCYKKKNNPLFALKSIYEESFSKLDPRTCTVLLHNISMFYEGQKIKINTGDTAYILKLNVNDYTRPIICLGEDVIDLSVQNEISIIDFLQ